MANASVYAAFERMWQHVIARLNDRASLEHTHEIAHVNGLETAITNKQDKEDNSLRTTDKTITGAINQLYDNSIANVTQSSYTSADGTPMTDIKIKMNNGYQHAFSIKEGGAQPDWNQNDENAPDYIKNRTHWFDEEEVDILSESTLNVDPETGSVIFEINTIPIIGQTYAVTYNSEEYNCVAGEYTDGKSTGVALGNIGAITGENMTDEPFIVVCVSDQIAVAMSLNGDESFTLKITGNGRVYHKVPDEYLPEFSRNIVDGIMPGSIRSITSCEEDGVNYVLGENASSFGENTKASGYGSHAEGGETIASGDFSHAEGNNTEASKGNSHAEGSNSKAYGYGSHAEGGETTASGDFSHTEGS